MAQPKSSSIFRVRELQLQYRPHRLDSPFENPLSDPPAVARLAAHLLHDEATEVALMLHLSTKHRLIGMHRIVGSLDRVTVGVSDVLRVALLSNARLLVFAHNHLSGDPEPSHDDRAIVHRLRDAVRMVDLELLDAVIVVDPTHGEQYFSFRTSGQL